MVLIFKENKERRRGALVFIELTPVSDMAVGILQTMIKKIRRNIQYIYSSTAPKKGFEVLLDTFILSFHYI